MDIDSIHNPNRRARLEELLAEVKKLAEEEEEEARARYRHKSIEVKAQQFHIDQKPWPDGVKSTRLSREYWIAEVEAVTLRKSFILQDGDWIITLDDGTKRVLSNAKFEKEYEFVQKASSVVVHQPASSSSVLPTTDLDEGWMQMESLALRGSEAPIPQSQDAYNDVACANCGKDLDYFQYHVEDENGNVYTEPIICGPGCFLHWQHLQQQGNPTVRKMKLVEN